MKTELKDLLYVGEYIKDRLYFATTPDNVLPESSEKYLYLCFDAELEYKNFYSDFGPLNLAKLYRYCVKMSQYLKMFSNRMIVHYTTKNNERRVNAAFLMASYAIINLEKTVEEALAPLTGKDYPQFLPFRDAATTVPIHHISLKDCLQAIYRAQALGFFRFDDFNLAEYEHYERVEEGDMNWIVPQKFLAFSGPTSHGDSGNAQEHAPEYYFAYFKGNNITNVIRLNRKSYDATRFTDSGFCHNDLYFLDGSTPSEAILEKFFKITENAKGAIAVHCKAGLGRTGSVIACYLMKHYRFSVGEAIAWVRICRPGSIIGIQQTWLQKMKPQLWLEGNRHRKKENRNPNFIPTHRFGIYSKEIHAIPNGPFENWQGEPLYEPSIAKKSDVVSKIARDIGAINLRDTEEAPSRLRASIRQIQTPSAINLFNTEEATRRLRSGVRQNYAYKNTFDLSPSAVRNSRIRVNSTRATHILHPVCASRSLEKEIEVKKPRMVMKRISCNLEDDAERERTGLSSYNSPSDSKTGLRRSTRSSSTPLTPLGAAKARLIQPQKPPKQVSVTRIYKIPIEVAPKPTSCLFQDANCNMTPGQLLDVQSHHFLRSRTRRRKENSNFNAQ